MFSIDENLFKPFFSSDTMPRKKKTEEKEVKEELKEEKKAKAEEAKEEVKETKKKKSSEELLVSVEDYIKYSAYLGTKVITAHMQKYVYRRRADGLAIFNTNLTDQKLRAAISLLSKYKPEEIVVCCKRRAGWNALETLNKVTGMTVFTKKYPAGMVTNPRLEGFFEPKLMFIVDPWLDKNPLIDAVHINIPIISICDTNNVPSYIDAIIPSNNKSNKSIGLLFWIIAREYCKARDIECKLPSVEEFIGPDVI